MTSKRAPVPPSPPKGLGPKARKIWRETVKKYDFRIDELQIFEGACRTIDIIEGLQKDIDDPKFQRRTKGSMGQPAIAPELEAIVKYRREFQRTMRDLGLPEEDDSAKASRSGAARELANARWRKGA